jgi:hypothetical protein
MEKKNKKKKMPQQHVPWAGFNFSLCVCVAYVCIHMCTNVKIGRDTSLRPVRGPVLVLRRVYLKFYRHFLLLQNTEKKERKKKFLLPEKDFGFCFLVS